MNAEPTTGSRSSTDLSTRGAVADAAATFAGALLIVTSLMDVIQGAAAVNDPDFFAAGADYTFDLDVATWGWVHLVLGVLSFVVAIGILMRTGWGQATGMVVAGLAMLTNFAWLPYHPLWAAIVIAFNAFVIWALSVQMRHYR